MHHRMKNRPQHDHKMVSAELTQFQRLLAYSAIEHLHIYLQPICVHIFSIIKYTEIFLDQSCVCSTQLVDSTA